MEKLSLEQAIEIIGNRRADTRLTCRASALLDDDVPAFAMDMAEVPVCLAPYVAGGTKGEVDFVTAVGRTTGRSVITSYNTDKYTNTNSTKANSWRPRIAWPKGQATRQWIVPTCVRQSGGAVGEAPTVFGTVEAPQTVADYQASLAKLAYKCAGLERPQTLDFSDWYERQSALQGERRSAVGYYPAVMALHSVFAVLYRYGNKPGQYRIDAFRRSVAEPAAEVVSQKLGVEPVIVTIDYPVEGGTTDLSQIETMLPEVADYLKRVAADNQPLNC